MDAATTNKRRGTTAMAGTEATAATIVIQATETTTPAEDRNSDHGCAISPPENSSIPRTSKPLTTTTTAGHTAVTFPTSILVVRAANSNHPACTTSTRHDRT